MRLTQLIREGERSVALVEGSRLLLLHEHRSVLALANAAIAQEASLESVVQSVVSGTHLDYDPVYEDRSEWKILPAADHPGEPSRCLVSGTGLTHMASATRRDAMHAAPDSETDSMRMYRWGVEGGKPRPGHIGTSPEWFYKGPGTILRAHNEPLDIPPYAGDGGEEPEIAGVYVIDPSGAPLRIGMALGNEFSDHQFEKRNYLYLAGSKLRACSLGPELVIDPDFDRVEGRVAIERGGNMLWSSPVTTGEEHMCHSLENLEYHHFKFAQHRRPGDLHVHYFGADAFSFGDGVELMDGDWMVIAFNGFGRPLRNPVAKTGKPEQLVAVRQL